uniref:Selenocysteine insertion sequence-binding protein 2 n=1 Tax=Lygus hesperus TaxID=30085 RepID=A0A0A9X1Q9_LYGHE
MSETLDSNVQSDEYEGLKDCGERNGACVEESTESTDAVIPELENEASDVNTPAPSIATNDQLAVHTGVTNKIPSPMKLHRSITSTVATMAKEVEKGTREVAEDGDGSVVDTATNNKITSTLIRPVRNRKQAAEARKNRILNQGSKRTSILQSDSTPRHTS